MNVLSYLKENIVYLDGGMGTLLQAEGLRAGELPERWNLSHSEVIRRIHRAYFDAGSNIVSTNTFGANRLKFSAEELEEIVRAAVENVRAAQMGVNHPTFVALDIGPTGRMLKPYGDLDFEEAVSVFAETVRLGVKYGVDLIFIETMNDSLETKAALLAAKENSDLPVFVSNAYGADGKLMTGADPCAMVALLEGMGADAIGVNCSLGPRALADVVREYLRYASIPVLLKPNAGLPKAVDGKTVYDVMPEEFAEATSELVRAGVRLVGGCCGTTPAYIAAAVSATKELSPKPIEWKHLTVVSSYTHAVIFGNEPILIGERINPTGKKRLKEALRNREIDYLLSEGIAQEEKGAKILDVNVGLPEIDEKEMLTRAISELQAVIDLPLQIDTADPVAMEAAMRRYNGKAMINSVNGKRDSMDAVFPLVKKYGGLVVALTLDEAGIPETAEGRLAIAKKILATAKEYGLSEKDLIFDPLAMTVSADPNAAKETLRAIRRIREELSCHTSLGVSNVSFGLPARDLINGTFFALALGEGLSAAIMNPFSAEMMKTYYSYRALCGLDENFADYLTVAPSFAQTQSVEVSVTADASSLSRSELQSAIIQGRKEQAAILTRGLLSEIAPLQIVQDEVIPALDVVGVGFEKKTVYLPQLLMSAEAAKAAFEEIKRAMPSTEEGTKGRVVLATVEGDIHDIGKNIVKLLLENYGFSVNDLGKDVSPEVIVSEAVRLNVKLVGLSALMTTTVPAMEKTIQKLKKVLPTCKIVVGGAVLTREYADAIGADRYAKDAMEAVRYAEEVYSNENNH